MNSTGLLNTMLNCTHRRRTSNRNMGTAASGLSEAVPQVTYINLLTSGKLNAYLADINEQAQELFHRLIEDMKQAQGITDS